MKIIKKRGISNDTHYEMKKEIEVLTIEVQEHHVTVDDKALAIAENESYAVLPEDKESNKGYQVEDTVILKTPSNSEETFIIKNIVSNADDFVKNFSWYDVFYMMSEVERIAKKTGIEDPLNNGYVIAVFG